MPDTAAPVPDFTKWPSFPFEGDLRVKHLDPPVEKEPPRKGEDATDCSACNAPDEAYIWVSERWRVRAMDRPTGLPMVLILESRSHLDLGDLPNLLAAELGVMTVRLERAVRSLDGVARVHVNRWGDGSAHLHMWFLARPYGRLQLRGTFLSLWDDILPPIPESTWRENLALVAAWLAEFGGKPLAEPPRIEWQAPSSLVQQAEVEAASLVQRAELEAASLALQAEADDTSVALVEAPDDEASTEGPTADEALTRGPTEERLTAEEAVADGRTEEKLTAEEAVTGGPAQEGPTPEGAITEAPTGAGAQDGTADQGATPGKASAEEPAGHGPKAGEQTASEQTDTAPAADSAGDSESAPAPTVPVARSGDQPAANGTKPEPERAAT